MHKNPSKHRCIRTTSAVPFLSALLNWATFCHFEQKVFIEWKVIYAVFSLLHFLGGVESQWTDCGTNALCLLQSNPSHQDLNTKVAWAQGYTGRGVVVTILDDGIEKDHPDLISNYASHIPFLSKIFGIHKCHTGLVTKPERAYWSFSWWLSRMPTPATTWMTTMLILNQDTHSEMKTGKLAKATVWQQAAPD